ncbi:hypothetical protein L0337_18480, partial [candidate division KSB1 bacterium]|nr:hypothetical protein [candidate division KSB1 bacterium]
MPEGEELKVELLAQNLLGQGWPIPFNTRITLSLAIEFLYSFRVKITVIARRFLPKQSLDFQRIASLRNAR